MGEATGLHLTGPGHPFTYSTNMEGSEGPLATWKQQWPREAPRKTRPWGPTQAHKCQGCGPYGVCRHWQAPPSLGPCSWTSAGPGCGTRRSYSNLFTMSSKEVQAPLLTPSKCPQKPADIGKMGVCWKPQHSHSPWGTGATRPWSHSSAPG